MRRLRLVLFAFFVVSSVAPALLAARELFWRELDVQARLAGDGTLIVSERHVMIFTGDWNGGERSFRLGVGHRITIDQVLRLDPTTVEWRPLEKGSLDGVDHWNWSDSTTLRWRSRLPSDAEFDATEIVYRLDYRLTGVLARRGERWRLDHDFAFPERVGPIERFALALDLDPEWTAPEGLAPRVEAGPLVPGEGWVVTADLEHRGASAPANAEPRRLSFATRAAAAAVAAIGFLAFLVWAIGRERAIGRFRRLPAQGDVDRAWLERNVLRLLPEEVGAAWDDTVGAAEVAAMLARLQLEGKLASRVESKGRFIFSRDVLHLTLLVERSTLSSAEQALIGGFFPQGDQTDTDFLRKHYRTSGFDPAGKVRQSLLGQVGRRPGFGGARQRPSRWPSVALILGGAAGIALSIVVSGTSVPVALLIALCLGWVVAFIAAMRQRDRVVGWGGSLVAIVIGQSASLAAILFGGRTPWLAAATFLFVVVFQLGLSRTVATAMQSRQGAERIARRRDLARARSFLRAELKRPQPRLDDAWLPYLIAFGLAPQMDRWFRAFGGPAVARSSSGWSGSGGGGVGGSGGGWTGGGGAFGGAGATASWTAAATAMSAGVSAASSSSGGGGGGGGSSGGGGGGGW